MQGNIKISVKLRKAKARNRVSLNAKPHQLIGFRNDFELARTYYI